MSIEGLTAVLLVFAAAGLWVAVPYLRGRIRSTQEDSQTHKQYERLVLYYERVLTNIRDLDEDLSTGKMSEQQHAAEREMWVQRGVQALQALDQLDVPKPAVRETEERTPEPVNENVDELIEAAVASYRKKPQT